MYCKLLIPTDGSTLADIAAKAGVTFAQVDGRSLLDERIDVGDDHEDLDGAASEHLARRRLIEIERVVVVDGTPRERSEILDPRVGLAAGAVIEDSCCWTPSGDSISSPRSGITSVAMRTRSIRRRGCAGFVWPCG